MGQKEKKEKYQKAKELGLDVKWTMSESDIETALSEYEASTKPEYSDDEEVNICEICGRPLDEYGGCKECESVEEEEDQEVEFIDEEKSIVKKSMVKPVVKPVITKKPVNRNQQYLKSYFPNRPMPKSSDILGKKKKK